MKKPTLAAFILAASLAPVVQAQGFDPQRIPVELQGWWVPAFGHIHAAVRLPLGQTVSGTLKLDVRVVIHDNPSKVFKVYATTESTTLASTKVDLTCPYDGMTETNCAFSVPLSLDTRLVPDGWRELRVKVKSLTPDGKTFYVSSSLGIQVENGTPDSDYSKFSGTSKRVGGVAYYTGVTETSVRFEDSPRAPVSGVYKFRVRTADSSTRLVVDLDKSHYIPAVGSWPESQPSTGTNLFDKLGTFSSTVEIPIDTRTLANGWHTLAAKSVGVGSAQSICSFCGSELSSLAAVSKIWFYVQN